MALAVACCHTQIGSPIPNPTSKSLFHCRYFLPKWQKTQMTHCRHPHRTNFLHHKYKTSTLVCRAETNLNPNEAVKDLLKSLIIPVATSFAVFSLALGAKASTFPRRLIMPAFANVSSITETKTVERGTSSSAEENPVQHGTPEKPKPKADSEADSIDAESPHTPKEEMQMNQHSEEEAQVISTSSVTGHECDSTENQVGEDLEQEATSPSGNQTGAMSEDSEELEFPENEELTKVYEQWKSKPYALTVPLKIVALRGSVPPAWLKDFMQAQGKRVKLQVEFQGSLGGIASKLSSDLKKGRLIPGSILAADLVTVGDSWLELAIRDRVIEPIKNADQQDWFIRLSDRWKVHLRRNHKGQIDPRGEIWGAPYRWGSMVVAYRKDKFVKHKIPPIQDWEDLWRPELEGKISMVDSPREVVGAILKCLGASYNSSFESDIPGGGQLVRTLFYMLQRQVRLFDSAHYLRAFASGDVWVAVGWSSDVLPAARRMSNVVVVVPKSGTSLWADFWAIPTTSNISSTKVGGRIRGPSPVINQWFDFCLQPARATPFQQDVFPGSSPLFLPDNTIDIKSEDDTLLKKPTNIMETGPEKKGRPEKKGQPEYDTNLVAGMPPADILRQCEFLEPLSMKAKLDYDLLLNEKLKGKGPGRQSSLWHYLEGIQEFFRIPTRGV